jgi:succinate-semialdehyde dehydrogenase/glutarate-semialdehyde dehydrogenase
MDPDVINLEMNNLDNPNLLRSNAYVDGSWRDSISGKRFDVANPATGERIASVADVGAADTLAAIGAAADALPGWSGLTAKKRSRILEKWHDLIRENEKDLARLMTAEQGKPFAESLGEIRYGAEYVKWFSAEALRVYGDTIPAATSDTRIVTIKQPVGVVAAITPWNFPMAMITRKVSPALAAGCTVVSKPAEDTPLSALALAYLAHEAGVPPGVFNVLPTSSPAAVGEVLTSSETVRKVSFTGSTEIGKLLMRQSAETVKKVSLELGGNAPFIVFDDADLEAAVDGAMSAKFRNAGQTCICANRIYVQSGIHQAFASALAERISTLAVGPGKDDNTQVGPLINEEALDKVERLVGDAVAGGAAVLVGGKRHELGRTFYQPTVVAGVSATMQIAKEEIFGPVASLIRFESEDEVIRQGNDTRYGLAAYFFTSDASRAWRVAEALEYGMVGINTGSISNPAAPFGGIKESGIGREGSKYGIEEFVEIKYLCWGGVR